MTDAGGRPLDCIILAAGASTRMGRPKLGMPFGRATEVPPSRGTVLGTSVAQALAAGARVIVVARPGDGAALAAAWPSVEVALNSDPSRGMASSLKEGLRLVRAERFFFTPADMPFIGPEVYRELARFDSASPILPTYRGRRGHPVLMPSALIPAIMALPAEVPLKTLIEASGPAFVEMADDSILRDIDTIEEYEKALAEIAARMRERPIPSLRRRPRASC
jgi:molybdenum cofactor cytidylyltransferase